MLRKNQKQVFTRVLIMVAMVALAVTALRVAQVGAAPHVAPPHSKAYGKTLAEWLTIYWRWFLEGGESKVGRVQLLPLPANERVSGNGTEEDPAIIVGELEITLPPGTPFVLTEFVWIGERYEGYPEVPDDEPIPDDIFLEWFHPLLTIDGRTIMSDENKAAFYVPPTWFDPPIEYDPPQQRGPELFAVAASCFQSFGIVSTPLPVGEHVIHLSGTTTSSLACSTAPGSSRWLQSKRAVHLGKDRVGRSGFLQGTG